MKQLNHIGTTEFISLPDEGIYDVPAKIDTGADGCSIWASDIKIQNGTLKFKVFGPGSVYYGGQAISTKEYKVVTVKNSFGEKEVRYVVRLSIKIGQKRYKVRFNLADRSRNHFPVLLGKNFLKQRFLVDVGSSYLLTPPEKQHEKLALVISSRKDKSVTEFYDAVQAKLNDGQKINIVHYNDLAFWFGKTPKVTNLSNGQDMGAASLIYIKNYKLFPEQAAAIAQYAVYKNIALRDRELNQTLSLSKLSEMMRLSCYGLPVPYGVAMPTEQFVVRIDEIVEKLGLPLVLKDVFSDRGKNNYFIQTKAELRGVLQKASKECLFVAQQFVPNDGFLRVLVLGKQAPIAVMRQNVEGKNQQKSHLNKPRGAANAALLAAKDMPKEALSLAIEASEVMQRQVAGVDLIRDSRTNEWYILEVNYNPEMVTASYVDEKAEAFAKYMKNELEKW